MREPKTPRQRKWFEIVDRKSRGGYESLSRIEKTWFNVEVLIGQVENGGVISYFYNSGADGLEECLKDLTALGAHEVRRQIERVCQLFPSGVPDSMDARNDVIDSWADSDELDSLLTEVDELVLTLMDDLNQRLNEFLEASGYPTE